MPDDTEVGSERRRRFLKYLTATAGAGSLAGCFGGEEAGTPTSGGATDQGGQTDSGQDGSSESGGASFTYALGSQPVNLSWWKAYDDITNPITVHLYDTLLEFNRPDMELTPALAKDWTIDDPTHYVYNLREGVTLHNGDEMTVDDVVASANLTTSSEASSPLAWMLSSVDSYNKVDDYTLEIVLSEPDATFQYVPATQAMGIAPKAAIDEKGTDLGQEPVGSGPFKFENWQSGSQVTLSRFEEYWDDDLPNLDEVTFQIVPGGTGRLTGLRQGDFHGSHSLSTDQYSVVEQMQNVDLHRTTSFQTTFQVMNLEMEPFDNPTVRRAINFATDTKAITESVVGKYGTPAISMLPENMFGHVTPDDLEYGGYQYDPDRARSMLDEAGLTGDPRFEFTLMTTNATFLRKPSIIMQEQLGEVGIKVNINQVEQSKMLSVSRAPLDEHPGMITSWWASDFPDPGGILNPVFHSDFIVPDGNNWFGYSNPDVDELLNTLRTSVDQAEREQAAKEANKLIVDDAPAVFMVHPDTTRALNQNVQNFEGAMPSFVTHFNTFLRDVALEQ
ncbi:ABC transporter substrate-binding protein [Salinirarus marinus]|uniref:ABC transporter substrate-binding protein n=2 Tax=Haloferacaceae TaxID=1644056 RepID=UPI003C6C1F26